MADFPIPFLLKNSLHTGSLESEAYPATVGVSISSSITDANVARLYPFRLEIPMRIRKLWVFNGATVAGNLDIGVYDSAMRLLGSTGSTAQSGTTTIQLIDCTDFDVPSGIVYLALVTDSATATFRRWAPSLTTCRVIGVMEKSSSFPLPSTIAPTTMTTGTVPLFGMVPGKVL